MAITSIAQMRDKDGYVTPEGWEELRKMSEAVQRTHYAMYFQDAEDLVMEGIVKGAQLIEDDRESGNYRSLSSYIYTGMRNAMSNYLYKSNREYLQLDTCSNAEKYSVPSEVPSFIPKNLVEHVISQVSNDYDIYIETLNKIVSALGQGRAVDLSSLPRKERRTLERFLSMIMYQFGKEK